MKADGLAEAPLDTVSHHGFTEGARGCKADVRAIGLSFANAKRREVRSRITGTVVVNSPEIFGSQKADTFRKTRDGNYLSELTVSFLRPRARRRDSTAWPFLVSIRVRKP